MMIRWWSTCRMWSARPNTRTACRNVGDSSLTPGRRKTMTTTRQLAERIAEALFTNGAGQQAERLVLTIDGPPKRYLGGWSMGPAI